MSESMKSLYRRGAISSKQMGRLAKPAILNKTTAQASELLGIGEPAVRKRIREGKLFALQTPVEGEHRIPAWALDPAVARKATVCRPQHMA